MEVRNKRLLTLMISVSLVVLVRLFTLVPIDEDSSVSGLSSASKKEGALGLPVFEDSGARPIDPNAANRIGDGVDGRACPTWTAFNRQMLVDLHPNDNELVCEDLPQTTNFTIKLCKSKEHCGTGLFALQHRDPRYCANVLANERISPNRRLEQYYKTAFGPDAFQLLLDGPQRETPPLWSHKGDCLYTLPFRLINPGTYTASLIHAYESFEAFKEMGDFGLKVLYEPLFKDFKFDVCDSTKCPVWTAKRVEDLSPSLPLCSRYEPIQVAYLRMTFETEREIRKHAFHKFIYIGEPIGCRYDQRFELEDLVEQAKCHNNNKTILLHGDSHLRVSTQTFDARLSGSYKSMA
ncbi:hypothetical protein BCR33DRAFT_38884 [Rhizoclosmatium globosum]|uniref:Uncharacterized protein n=1 Tax=Rhizoclosmatium globosum TaxID=329046 RepID=A0A1Y2CNI4_9FUNG|nr:hypothetical protein BCR33DRAFT_38884 [Rhizoclosmatium globosum]|eukprot:ORY48572.1 hypothetical protein BCR33DRAFT_38884 [Rhizoclosmatium globosum]